MLGIGLVMAAGAARAADDDEDDKTFEEKIIEGIMAGIGGTNMENRGIEYRERSPLVVPPKLDLPPPASARGRSQRAELAEGSRRAAPQGCGRRPQEREQGSPRSRPPPDAGRTRRRQDRRVPPRTNNDPIQPGTTNNNPILSPSQLGYNGGFSGMFGGNKTETAPFKGEPTRESLTAAAERLPDAVAELRLRHRAEGIAEQGIQPGRRQVWRIGAALSYRNLSAS